MSALLDYLACVRSSKEGLGERDEGTGARVRHQLDPVLSRPSPLSSIPSFDAGSEDLATITSAVWRTVLARNDPPRLFRFGAIPSRLEEDDNGAPALRPLTPARARHEMVRSAHWFKWAKRGGESVELASYPSRAVVNDFLATPNSELPVLTRIVQSPTFAPDGTLHREPGYNASTKVFYHCGPGFEVPTIAETPRADEVANAVQLLSQDLLGDFPFVGAAEKATALAALILPFVRDMIPGPTPIHLLEKSTPGTGATLLADCLTFPALGRPLVAMTEGRDEDEWRKRLLAKLRAHQAAVNIDNVPPAARLRGPQQCAHGLSALGRPAPGHERDCRGAGSLPLAGNREQPKFVERSRSTNDPLPAGRQDGSTLAADRLSPSGYSPLDGAEPRPPGRSHPDHRARMAALEADRKASGFSGCSKPGPG